MAEADASSFLRPGDVYEGYEIIEEIGTGGFSWVFSARHEKFPQPVALKLSRKRVDSETAALRALREIRILGSLANPNVIHIYDNGLGADQRWYMVMELLEGDELTRAHDLDVPMSPMEAVRIIQQAALGLDEAHRQGIVHRDMKPDNIWLLPDRSVKVLDFGLARAWDVESTIGADATMGHMLVGTPHYSQPEQILTGVLSPASDVYSLGVLLYELLTGRTPLFADRSVGSVKEEFESQPLKWLLAHQKNEVVPLERYPEGAVLPEKLRALVMSTLAKEPEKRPPNAGVLANWLGWILHHELGAESGANLRVTYPSGDARELRVLPGVHKVGVGRGCGIKLADADHDTAYATLEWAGVPYEAELVPLVVDGTVKINGHVLDYRVRLVAGTQMDMGAFRLELRYPETMSPAS